MSKQRHHMFVDGMSILTINFFLDHITISKAIESMQQLTIATVAFVGLIVDSIVKSIFLDFELDAVQSLHLYNFTVGAYLHHDINDTEINHTAMPRVRGGKC